MDLNFCINSSYMRVLRVLGPNNCTFNCPSDSIFMNSLAKAGYDDFRRTYVGDSVTTGLIGHNDVYHRIDIVNTGDDNFLITIRLTPTMQYISNACEVKPQAPSISRLKIRETAIQDFADSMCKDTPAATEEVAKFIAEFNYFAIPFDLDKRQEDGLLELLHQKYANGYCYHFASILKSTFKRGAVCYVYDRGHFVWMDEDGVPYDIDGVNHSDCEYYIPEGYIGEGIYDFLRIPGKEFNASEDFVNSCLTKYLEDIGES